MVRFLERWGMRVMRISGSHHFLEGRGRRTSVAVHAGKTVPTGTIGKILRDVGLSPEEFARLWNA